MIKNLVNLFTGKNGAMDDARIREINRMEMELEKSEIERELSFLTDRMIHRI
ncbi:hypothetical protein ABB02_01230 [Clostridiaceae bacterium JG1575]|nr:hypothetical protein ABB02_01230 [Clostridiaceae bacterium JG1575]